MHAFRSFALAAAVAVVLAPAVGSAQVESTPIPTSPKPNFAPIAFMVGTWDCTTKSSRRPAPFVSTSTYSMDPTGYWMVETTTVKPTSWVKNGLTTTDKITYDPDAKRWVDVLAADQGGYGLSFSKGWMGNHMTWHDVSFAPGADISSQTDVVMTKDSAAKVTSTSTFTETKTGRHVSVVSACTKT